MELNRITKIMLIAVAFWAVLILLECWSGPSMGLFGLQGVDLLMLMGLTWREYIENSRQGWR